MGRPLADYIALGIIGDISDEFTFLVDNARAIVGSWEEVKARSVEKIGFEISEELFSEAIRTLSRCGLVRITNDDFSGAYLKISADKFNVFVKKVNEEFDRAKEDGDELYILRNVHDFPMANAWLTHELLEDYSELGDSWLRKAFDGLRDRVAEVGGAENLEEYQQIDTVAPASDRIVTLSHNQNEEMIKAVENVEGLLKHENSIDADTSMRERFVAQLAAGRELLRSSSVRAYLVYETLVRMLGTLIQKYKEKALGVAAEKLLNLLIEHIFGK